MGSERPLLALLLLDEPDGWVPEPNILILGLGLKLLVELGRYSDRDASKSIIFVEEEEAERLFWVWCNKSLKVWETN